MKIDELNELLVAFLERWPLEKIQTMTIEEYVGIGNKDTFCQWVETKTRMLGSIKGLPGSIKFGIYERKSTAKKPKKYRGDDKYSWLKGYGDNYTQAFENLKSDIIKIIQYAYVGEIEKIDNMLLSDMFKWKIAFLYSNERLIPIFKRDVLNKIANHFGLVVTRQTSISEIQNLMILNKPAEYNVYEFMLKLYHQFGTEKETKENIKGSSLKSRKAPRSRKGSNSRNTDTQFRTITRSYIAEQKHNKIQKTLKRLLIEEFGESNVILEENFVDIKLLQPDYITFYEVKSSSFATECIKQALGQILLYSFNDEDLRPKKHVIVGQYPATANDQKFINFIKHNLKLEIDYLDVGIQNVI